MWGGGRRLVLAGGAGIRAWHTVVMLVVLVGICYENISALGYQSMFSMDHGQQSAFIISQAMRAIIVLKGIFQSCSGRSVSLSGEVMLNG